MGGNIMRKQFLNRVAIMYPSGNTTAVVFDDVAGMDLAKLNTQICNAWQKISPNSPPVEQCCYLAKPANPECLTKVVLFGGEFSGNTARSAVGLLCDKKQPNGLVEVSGAKYPLKYTVNNGEISLSMPIPDDICVKQESNNIMAVRLDGITHYVVLTDTNSPTISPNKILQKAIQAETINDDQNPPAIGVVGFNKCTKMATFLIWVEAINTLFDETACGSGTSAIAVAMAYANKKNQRIKVTQPSGEIIVGSAKFDNGKVTESTISGDVSALYDGQISLN